MLLACCVGFSAGLSCTSRKPPSSSPQSPPSQVAADAEATKKQAAADAEDSKKAEAAAKLKKEQDDTLAKAQAKALKQAQAEADRKAKAAKSDKPRATDTNAPMTKAQKLDDLTRRYMKDGITPDDYHAERAKIAAEPDTPETPAPQK
jgi:colicin import membrane protein